MLGRHICLRRSCEFFYLQVVSSPTLSSIQNEDAWICHIEKLNLTAGRDTAATSFKQHYRLQLFAFWYFMIPNLELFLQRGCRPSVGSGLIRLKLPTLGSLSKGVFERRTSTGSEVFSLLTCLDDIKFVFLSFFTVIEAIWLKICAKPPSKNQKTTSGWRASLKNVVA